MEKKYNVVVDFGGSLNELKEEIEIANEEGRIKDANDMQIAYYNLYRINCTVEINTLEEYLKIIEIISEVTSYLDRSITISCDGLYLCEQ